LHYHNLSTVRVFYFLMLQNLLLMTEIITDVLWMSISIWHMRSSIKPDFPGLSKVLKKESDFAKPNELLIIIKK